MTKVLIVSDQSLFGQGLEDLLRHQQEIELVDQKTDADELPNLLELCRPDVVLFGCSDADNCPAPVFARSLREGFIGRIMCVNLQDNALYIFRGERHIIEKIEDLVEALTHQPPGA